MSTSKLAKGEEPPLYNSENHIDVLSFSSRARLGDDMIAAFYHQVAVN